MKKNKFIISGINIVDGGALSIFKDFLDELVKEQKNDIFDIILLVNSKEIFSEYKNKFKFIEFPKSKKHWFMRFYYEYIYFYFYSKKIKPFIWLSMHDITPNVVATKRFVYCHNPSPFYQMKLSEAKYGWKYYMFSKFYKYLYKINIKKNNCVVVQQEWMAQKFQQMYNITNNKILVAKPENVLSMRNCDEKKHENQKVSDIFNFFYPSYPRPYKNFEQVCEAIQLLNKENNEKKYELILTISGEENKYAKMIKKKFGTEKCIKFIGVVSREKIFELYQEADCLIFMSKLETWGMPISEFKNFNKPIITTTLPYSRETAANYKNCYFVDVDNPEKLASIMTELIENSSSRTGVYNKSDDSSLKFGSFVEVHGWNEFLNCIVGR